MTDEVSAPTHASNNADNSKPVVLHVLHSWGGGIDFFARDLQAGDQQRTHFFLKSHSRDNLPPFGKELCLYGSLDDEPLATWHLSAPIMDTDLHSEEVTRILNSIIEKWTVGAVIVSSLIGHSLDVLRTGLPTALVVHDLYPYWPLLHDANTTDHSIVHLRQALIDSKAMNIFVQHEAEYWLAIRDELISLILQNHIACISPSTFAKERVCRIDSRLNDAHWSIVPHGIGLTARASESTIKESTGNLKVLVPGHINGGKGELLLKELIPRLPDGIELVLLGSAHLSNEFASAKVTTIDHYRREELGDFVGKIQPDIAMLVSTVPETYGYVLSEMLQLGIPVICSNVGAYAERGQHLPGVTLLVPSQESFLETLVRFRDNPDQLAEQRKSLPYVFPDLKEMAASWRDVLPANPPQWLFILTDDQNIEDEVKMNLQITHLAEILKTVHAATEKNSQLSNEALNLIAKQQSNIEALLASLNTQSAHMTTLFAKHSELESAIHNQNQEFELVRINAERIRSEFELKLVSMHETARADKLAHADEVAQLQNTVSRLDQALSEMQAKRGWRFLSFFR